MSEASQPGGARQQLQLLSQHTRCILTSGVVVADEGWRAFGPGELPIDWRDVRVTNPVGAQLVLPLEVPPGSDYLTAWRASRHPEDNLAANLSSGRAFLGDLPSYRNEWRCRDRFGAEHWLQQEVTVQRLAEGRWQVFGIATDITAVKAAEANLQEVALHTHCILSSGVVTADPGWRETGTVQVPSNWREVKVLNPAGAQLVLPLDVPEGGNYQDAWRAIRRPDDLAQANLNAGRAFRDGLPTYRNAWRCLDRFGVEHALQQVVTVKPLAEGRWHIFSTTTDVTELQAAVAARAEVERHLRTVLTNARCILWHADVTAAEGWETRLDDLLEQTDWKLNIEDVQGAQRVVALEVPEGRSYAEVWFLARHPDDRRRMAREAVAEWALLRGEPGCVQEFRTIDRHGEAIWLREEISIQPLGERHWRLVGVVTDISDRKRAEEERLDLERRVQQSQRLESLGVLAGGIAHDFNNLLQGIQGNAELIGMLLEPGTEVAPMLADIITATGLAADLCRQMLAYAGRGRLAAEAVDLAGLARELAQLLHAAVARRATLELDLPDDLPAVWGDAAQLRQVVMNLVLNGSEALGGAQGSIRVSAAEVELDESPANLASAEPLAPGSYLRLSIADTGCGMSPATLARIFEPFFSTKFTGRGLGLSAVLGIVQRHHGGLTVDSSDGQGSTFTVLLPVAVEPPVSGAERPPEPEAVFGSGTILLVDDEAVVRDTSTRMLATLGFDVLTAVDGLDALEVYAARRADIDLVLLDLTMPRMDGEECLRRLRTLDPAVRVVVASGYSETELARRFDGVPLVGTLRKPYAFDTLRRLLVPLLPAPAEAQ